MFNGVVYIPSLLSAAFAIEYCWFLPAQVPPLGRCDPGRGMSYTVYVVRYFPIRAWLHIPRYVVYVGHVLYLRYGLWVPYQQFAVMSKLGILCLRFGHPHYQSSIKDIYWAMLEIGK